MEKFSFIKKYFFGVLVCSFIGVLVYFFYDIYEVKILDPLIASLFFGILIRIFKPDLAGMKAGSSWSGKGLLEFSVMMIGANIAISEVFESGFWLLGIIIFGVCSGMFISYIVGHRLLGLDKKISTLVGAGNSICGNSAVIAIAPVIGATPPQIATVISFSAILGALQIILLPLIFPNVGIGNYDYGVIAGISVYAVSQVVAASSIVSPLSASVATTVKLTRVLLLGPLVILLGVLFNSNKNIKNNKSLNLSRPYEKIFNLQKYLPWFVIGFLILTFLRSTGIIQANAGGNIFEITKILFSISMVGIGMGVDIKEIINLGPKIAIAVLSVMMVMIFIGLLGIFII